MLSTAADVAQLAQAAPWLAVGALALVASAWVYRQGRRAQKAAEDRCQLSALRQGKRLGELEQRIGLLELRRRQVEWVLLDEGLELPYWPPDGAEQPTPRRRPRPAPHVDEDQADDDQADDDGGPRTTSAPYLPVPPLPDEVAARHRRRAATP